MLWLFLLFVTYSVKAQLLGPGNFGIGGGIPEQQAPVKVCPDAYTAIPGHTLCLPKHDLAMELDITKMDINLILSEHNNLRASVTAHNGASVNTPSDLAKLTWDDNLAKIAKSWANQCPMENDAAVNRSVPEYGVYVGQNMYSDQRYTVSWKRVFDTWIAEKDKYKYGEILSAISNYTQLISNATTRVGCGYARCISPKWGNYYVCNYAIGQENSQYPFTSGNRCSACPGNCVGGVCANGCEGKLCRNGGTLDFSTCTCTCTDMYSGPECEKRCGDVVCSNGGTLDPNTCTCICVDLYTGPKCETLNCPTADDSMCMALFDKSYCTQGEYFHQKCPYMCGLCTGNHGTYISDTTPSCTYKGVRQSSATCLGFGYKGTDTIDCASKDGQYDCTYCSHSSIQKVCPIMCGICEEQQPVYNSTQGCVYHGSRPSMEECSQYGDNGKDYSVCKYIDCQQCQTDSIVKTNFCPQLCGLCP